MVDYDKLKVCAISPKTTTNNKRKLGNAWDD